MTPTPLKPCPFCQTIPEIRDRAADKCEQTNTGKIWSITCYGGQTNAHAWFYADTKRAVVDAWNRRPPLDALSSRPDRTEEALGLALAILVRYEPGDSRAVSDEFVAMAAIASGDPDANGECIRIIREARARVDALPPLEPEPVTVTFDATPARPEVSSEGVREKIADIADHLGEISRELGSRKKEEPSWRLIWKQAERLQAVVSALSSGNGLGGSTDE